MEAFLRAEAVSAPRRLEWPYKKGALCVLQPGLYTGVGPPPFTGPAGLDPTLCQGEALEMPLEPPDGRWRGNGLCEQLPAHSPYPTSQASLFPRSPCVSCTLPVFKREQPLVGGGGCPGRVEENQSEVLMTENSSGAQPPQLQ